MARVRTGNFVADCRRIWLWAFVLPLVALLLAPFTYGVSVLVLFCAYGCNSRTFTCVADGADGRLAKPAFTHFSPSFSSFLPSLACSNTIGGGGADTVLQSLNTNGAENT